MRRKRRFLTAFILIVMTLALLAGCGSPKDGATPVSTPTVSLPAQTETPDAETSETGQTLTQSTAAAHTQASVSQTQSGVRVMFINVGYGDAILVQLDGQSFLIDTGAKKASASLLRALALCGVDRLDGVFLTHTHKDHIGGLKTAAARYEIGALYAGEITESKKKIDKLAEGLSLEVMRLSAGDTVETASGAAFEVLGPLEENADDDNDNSLVLRLRAGGYTWLFTGDMQFDEELSLRKAGVDLSADILKVGNHGNPDATAEWFAEAVHPQTAVISTSTEEDADSANPRVRDALSMAEVDITQDYVYGVLMEADGALTVSDPQPAAPEADIQMTIDAEVQTVTLTGEKDTDLSGWFIWSEKGGKLFVFPQGAVLKAGKPLTVACRKGNGDYIWDEKKVWSGKNGQAGILYTGDGAGGRQRRSNIVKKMTSEGNICGGKRV